MTFLSSKRQNMTYSTLQQHKRLKFGVPLEDVFSSYEIPPRLKALFEQAYHKIVKNRYKTEVEELLRRRDESLSERLYFKNRLTQCNTPIDTEKVSAGLLIWLIRHFIGVLPLPVLASQIRGNSYHWIKLLNFCLDNSVHKKPYAKVVRELAKEMIRLPVQNFAIIANLLAFIRSVMLLPLKDRYHDDAALFALVVYFAPALFLRPYRPGFVTQDGNLYARLLVLMVTEWPQIRSICSKQFTSIHLIAPECYNLDETLCTTETYKFTIQYSHDVATQTPFSFWKNLDSSISCEASDFLHLNDSTCQTDAFGLLDGLKNAHIKKTNLKCKPERVNSYRYRITVPIEISEPVYANSVESIKTKSMCGNDVDAETLKINQNTDHAEPDVVSVEENSNSESKSGKISSICDAESDISGALSSKTHFSDSTGYVYDNYSCFDLLGNEIHSNSSGDVNVLDPVGTATYTENNSKVKERVSNTGSTCTSPTTERFPYIHSENSILPGVGWDLPATTPYQMCFDVVSGKESTTSVNGEQGIGDATDEKMPGEQDLAARLDNSKTIKERRSFTNIKKKFDFLKTLGSKKNKSMRNSCEDVTSQFKYKRIGSASSLA